MAANSSGAVYLSCPWNKRGFGPPPHPQARTSFVNKPLVEIDDLCFFETCEHVDPCNQNKDRNGCSFYLFPTCNLDQVEKRQWLDF
jgi:hypothetical protein